MSASTSPTRSSSTHRTLSTAATKQVTVPNQPTRRPARKCLGRFFFCKKFRFDSSWGLGGNTCPRNQYFLKGGYVLKFFSVRGFFLFSWLMFYGLSHAQAEKIPEVSKLERSLEQSDLTRQIRTVFADAPQMVRVAKCESGLVHRQNGALIQNRNGSSARGVFQVLMRVHQPQMQKMGLNPERTDHYLAYVRYLFDQYGLTPWQASKHCWAKDHTHSRG